MVHDEAGRGPRSDGAYPSAKIVVIVALNFSDSDQMISVQSDMFFFR
jgi:hypothetical protein